MNRRVECSVRSQGNGRQKMPAVGPSLTIIAPSPPALPEFGPNADKRRK
jgi:hypothetical protein